MELLFTSILRQVPASSKQVPASSKQVPASSKSPKEGPILLTSGRCNARNMSKCKQCREEQKILLLHTETGRTHHYSRANCIPDMYIRTCVRRKGDWCASAHLHFSQRVLSVHGIWSTFLKSSEALPGVLLWLPLI